MIVTERSCGGGEMLEDIAWAQQGKENAQARESLRRAGREINRAAATRDAERSIFSRRRFVGGGICSFVSENLGGRGRSP